MSLARILATARFEARLLVRNGESLLLVAGLPILLLVFFSTVEVLPSGDRDGVDVLVPGNVTLAVFSTAFVNLAISTGFDRQYGALKRLGASPLQRSELIAAKILVVTAVVVVQTIALLALGALLGWTGPLSPELLVPAIVLGVIGFSGLGLLLAGRLPGLLALAAANAIYVVLLLVSGLLIPLDELPGALAVVARVLPTGALVSLVDSATSDVDAHGSAWWVLLAWAVLSPVLAARLMRWAPERR